MATGQWWVIGYFASEPESITEDINGEPPTSTKIIQGTLAQAKADASIAVNGRYFGPYPSRAAAQTAIKGGNLVGNQSPAGKAIAGASGLNPAQAIEDIWSKLNDRGTWIRLAEGALGIALIATVSQLPATLVKNASKVAKVVK